jgi:hypothetical protein
VLFVHCSRTLVELTAVAENTVGPLSVVRVLPVYALTPLWQVVVSGQPGVPVLKDFLA